VSIGSPTAEGSVPAPARPPGFAFGLLVLFALPFAGVGLVTAVLAAGKLLAGDWKAGAFMSVFALVFGGAGVGLIAAGIAGRRAAEQRAIAAARHPAEPWVWRADWAQGSIEDTGRKGTYLLWAFAALWNLIAWPTAALVVRAALEQGNRLALLGLLFPLVGIVLVVAAVRGTWRERKFGVSVFDLATRLKGGAFFVGVFGLVELVLLYAVLRMWLRVVEVTASRDGVAIASGFGGVGDPRRIPAAEVAGVETGIGMQAGNTVYYSLTVVGKDGRRVTAGTAIRDKLEAEWLAGLIKQAIGT
jgi:hypothetical protein